MNQSSALRMCLTRRAVAEEMSVCVCVCGGGGGARARACLDGPTGLAAAGGKQALVPAALALEPALGRLRPFSLDDALREPGGAGTEWAPSGKPRPVPPFPEAASPAPLRVPGLRSLVTSRPSLVGRPSLSALARTRTFGGGVGWVGLGVWRQRERSHTRVRVIRISPPAASGEHKGRACTDARPQMCLG